MEERPDYQAEPDGQSPASNQTQQSEPEDGEHHSDRHNLTNRLSAAGAQRTDAPDRADGADARQAERAAQAEDHRSRERTANGGPRSRLLTAKAAIEYLGISLSTLNRIEKRGLLVPFRTPGGHRRYAQTMLDEYLENTRKLPNPEGAVESGAESSNDG